MTDDDPMFEASHWRQIDLIEELQMEADAIGVGSGAPTARLLRRAAEQLATEKDIADAAIKELAAQPMPASVEIAEEPAGTLIANLIRLNNDANAEIVTLTMERDAARGQIAVRDRVIEAMRRDVGDGTNRVSG